MIKKLLFKVTLLVGVLMGVPYYLLGGGQMPGFLKNIIPAKTTQAKLPKNVTNVVTDKEVTYYKWVDDQGHTHFSNTPPTGQQAEMKTLRPDTNIVKAVKQPEKEEDSGGGSLFSLGGSSKQKDKDGKDVDPTELENPYSPEGVKNLMKKAQKAAEMMNQHTKELGKISGVDSRQ